MIVKIDKSFKKDTNKIKNKLLLKKIADCIENVQTSKSIDKMSPLRKVEKARHCEERSNL